MPNELLSIITKLEKLLQSEQIKKNVELGIIRNHYVGRTFIEPTQQIRSLGVKLKHNVNKSLIKNKSIILIELALKSSRIALRKQLQLTIK